MYFTGQNLPLPHRPFPFDPSAQELPTYGPDCHSDRTVIPCLSPRDSLGVFHNKTIRLLASFARMVSRSDNVNCVAITFDACPLSPQAHSRQATLHAARDSAHHIAGSYQARTRWAPLGILTIVAQHQVSTEVGSYAPCHWDAPEILNPQHPP